MKCEYIFNYDLHSASAEEHTAFKEFLEENGFEFSLGSCCSIILEEKFTKSQADDFFLKKVKKFISTLKDKQVEGISFRCSPLIDGISGWSLSSGETSVSL